MPPVERFVCRFAAEPPQEALPHGAWAQTLQAEFLAACLRVETEEDDPDLGAAGEINWFPDRALGGRTYVPATAPTSNGYELFGCVSFTREHEGAEATAFEAFADYTDETADANPDWELDLSDHELGPWRGPEGRRTRAGRG